MQRADWQFAEDNPVGVDLAGAVAVAAFDRDQGTDPSGDDGLLVGRHTPTATHAGYLCRKEG